jgi:hypothetical protein
MFKKLLLLVFVFVSFNLSAQVNFQWIKKFNTGGITNEARLITTDVAGNIYVCFYTNKYNTGLDIITIKYNSNGDSLWTRRYNDSLNLDNTPKALLVDGQNSVIIAGNTATPSNGLDGLLIKYSPNGAILWIKTYNGLSNADDDFRQISLDNLNSIYVVGSTKEPGYADLQCLTVKYDAFGNKLWDSKYGGIPYAVDYGFAICVDPTNQFCYVGAQNLDTVEISDIALIKYGNNFGDSVWVRRIRTSGDGYWFQGRYGKIVTDNSGNPCLATFTGHNTQYHDYLLMKYNTAGDSLWIRTYGEVAGTGDEIKDIKIDNSKNVYITGVSNIGNNSNWSTIKYDSLGNRKWVNVYNRANYFDVPCGLYIDKQGNILVGGYGTVTTLPYSDYILNKYNPNTGALINSYIYTNNYYDYAYAMAKDTSDNVYLTGIFSTTSSIIDFATMKLSPSTAINQISTEIPANFSLHQNYPNPFNPTTKIKFDIPQKTVIARSGATWQSQSVSLKVFDIIGKEIATLVSETLQPGTYEVTFDGNNLPSGIYFYQLKTEKFSETKKLILLK